MENLGPGLQGKLRRGLLPLLLLLWAVFLLGDAILGNNPGSRDKQLSVPVRNSDMVDKGFIQKASHVMCPYATNYRLGTPMNATDGCRCDAGWEGDTCQSPICARACENGGKCSGPSLCKCRRGWKGKLCGEAICSPGCGQHGTCTGPNECTCDTGWAGLLCGVPCLHGKFQKEAVGADGRPLTSCRCDPGWHGKDCSTALCEKFGCVNGDCTSPDVCSCDGGWRGADCADDSLLPASKSVLRGVAFDRPGFGDSLLVTSQSSDADWRRLREFTSWTSKEHAAVREVLAPLVALNDTLAAGPAGATSSPLSSSQQRPPNGKRWRRCAVVGDGSGLLRTELGEVIDRHDAVLRFNLAPLAGMEGHVGRKTTLRLLNKKSIEVLLKHAGGAKGSRTKTAAAAAAAAAGALGNPPVVPHDAMTMPGGTLYLLWRPDTYSMLPRLRRHCPKVNAQILRSDWSDAAAQSYKTLFKRLLKEALIGDDGSGGSRHPDEFVDPTMFAEGRHRVPTSFAGVSLMVQLCGQVNVFGFDPTSVRGKTRSMGYPGPTYYRSQLHAVAASEAEDEAVVLADQDPGGSLRPSSKGKDTGTVELHPDGEQVPGAGGSFADGSLDGMMLRLLELSGHITLCTSDHPERCLASSAS